MLKTERLWILQQELYQLDIVYTDVGYQIWVSDDPDELRVFGEEAGRIKDQLTAIRQQILQIDTISG